MFNRVLHNSIFHWNHCTQHIKRTFYFSCIKNSSTLTSNAHQNILSNTNCVPSKKCLLGFHWRNKLNQLLINQWRCNHGIGIPSPECRTSVLLKLHSHHRNLSSQNGTELPQDATRRSKQDGDVTKAGNNQNFCLSKRDLICVCGSDSVSFLQGLVTNDMTLFQRENRKALYAMILNVQGRVIFDLIIYAVPHKNDGGHCFYLECDTNASADLIKFLKRYKIRKKVTVTDLKGEYQSWASLSSRQRIKESISEEETKEVLLCDDDPRVPEFGSRLILPHDTSFLSSNEKEYHVRRYQLGIGEGIEDLPPGNCYPLECNLQFENGVSFQKGCYIGQELTARTHHRGVVRKRLMPILFESVPEGLSNGDKITDIEGKNLGKFRNHEGTYGLALLRVGQALKANESAILINDYKLKTHIPTWWPTYEV